MIEPCLETLENRHRNQRRQLCKQVSTERIPQRTRDHLCKPFGRLQGDIADEAITHHNVGRAFKYIVALNIAIKIQTARTQQFCSTFDDFVALDFLFANIQQAHAGLFLVLKCRSQQGSHDAELEKMFRRAIHIGPKIEHIGGAFLGGKNGTDCRTINAL